VLAPRQAVGIVAFGDSLTEGNISQLYANPPLARPARASARRAAGRAPDRCGESRHRRRPPAPRPRRQRLRRSDRQVPAQPGVTHVVLLLGVNDLRNSRYRRCSEHVRLAATQRADATLSATAPRCCFRSFEQQRSEQVLGDKLGANSPSFQATPGHRQRPLIQLISSLGDTRRHTAMVRRCLLSLIAAAVALP
jgi:lysophospholipase L1-like esterase